MIHMYNFIQVNRLERQLEQFRTQYSLFSVVESEVHYRVLGLLAESVSTRDIDSTDRRQ